MEKLLTLDEITLYPSELNNGYNRISNFNYGVTDSADNVTSLPIFTSPNPDIINEYNCEYFSKAGIRPVLPRTISLENRLNLCQVVFANFTLEEINENFLVRGKRASNTYFFISIDSLNGADINILNMAIQLKKVYGDQVVLMAGCIGNYKTYLSYSKAGIEYARVGCGSSSSVRTDKYGFYYPLGSLLIDIYSYRATSGIGLKHSKIVADGGINTPADIMKCFALGADYVMLGNQFATVLESAGQILQKKMNGSKAEFIKVDPSILNENDIKLLDLYRYYGGLTKNELQASLLGYSSVEDYLKDGVRHEDCERNLIKITCDLNTWLSNFYNCSSNAFILSNATNWEEFRTNVKYARI